MPTIDMNLSYVDKKSIELLKVVRPDALEQFERDVLDITNVDMVTISGGDILVHLVDEVLPNYVSVVAEEVSVMLDTLLSNINREEPTYTFHDVNMLFKTLTTKIFTEEEFMSISPDFDGRSWELFQQDPVSFVMLSDSNTFNKFIFHLS